MKKQITAPILLFFVLCLCSYTQISAQRIIGYYPDYVTGTPYLNIQFTKLTHLYYFSLNPVRTSSGVSNGQLWTAAGNPWFTTARFNAVTAQARSVNPNIKIFLVTGGSPGTDSDLNARFTYIGNNPAILNVFCNNILNFLKANNLDGWDLDWEFPDQYSGTSVERTAHQNMLAKMRTKMDSMKLADCKSYEMSIAVGGGYTNRTCWNPAHTSFITATALTYPDFVNIMSYDGPTSSGSPVACYPASPYSHQDYTNVFQRSFTEWSSTYFTIPAAKINMGVGFYANGGTAFNSGGNNSTYYSATYYWGTGGAACPDIQRKADWLKTQGGAGFIIWELTQDNLCAGTVPACYSLLDCMYQRMQSTWGTWPGTTNPCGSLPVSLTAFNGYITELNTAEINWNAASETQHDYYILQRSDDAINFSDVATFTSKGSAARAASYSYTDLLAARYYRLVMVSVDGEKTYSRMLDLDTRIIETPPYPNPSAGSFTLELNPEYAYTIQLIHLNGQVLSTETYIKGTSIITLGEELAAGCYLLKVTSPANSHTYKINKQ